MPVLGADATAYRLTRPFRLQAFSEPMPALASGSVLLRPLRTGICGSDLKLYSGSREAGALLAKLPIALLHEAVAEVCAVAPDVPFRVGQQVIPSPNIPCTIAYPELYPSLEEACYACRPGGAGANYCLAGKFLSSNADGMARTAFAHPAACCLRVPSGVPDNLAVLSEPMATILAGLEHARIRPGARAMVLGDGAMAMLTAVALRATRSFDAEAILMTGRRWDTRAAAVEGLATPVDADAAGAETDRIDVAFECVGGDASAQTMATMVDVLRPGGVGMLFGPSEVPFQFDARKVIAKGLTFVGCNRALNAHFQRALQLFCDPALWPLLERALSSKEFTVRSVDDLDDALYHAWTNTGTGRTVAVW